MKLAIGINRVIRSTTFSLLVLHICGCGQLIRTPVTHQKVQPTEFGIKHSPEQLRSDLDFLIQTCESVHPNLYAAISRDELCSLKQRTASEITAPMTRVQFYPLVARVVSRINDSHTSAGFPNEEWNAYIHSDQPLFPFGVSYGQERLIVARTLVDEWPIRVGDEMRSVNGVAISKFAEGFFDQVGGERTYHAAQFGPRFHQLLWLNDIHSPFVVEYMRENDPPATLHVVGLSQKQINERMNQKPASPAPTHYEYRRLDSNIAYIDFRQMVEAEKFDKFLQDTLQEIHDDPPAGLVIDLRRNGGGNSALGQRLFEYITDKKYKMSGRKEWKASPEYKRYLRNHMAPAIRWMPLHMLHPIGRKFLCAPDGKIVIFEGDVYKPARRLLRYDGPVCFLIGPGTFSSAMMTADAVAEFDLATLIGEETGGQPNGYGEVYSFDLPHTRLNIGVSSARFVRASGDESNPRGVFPDIEVKQTAEDREKGIDTVLERAKRWIHEQAAQSGA